MDHHVDLSSSTPGESLAAILQRLDEIDVTRRRLNVEELFLKERSNSFAPINRLPHEIFTMVLVLYEDENRNRELPRNIAWLRIVSTCRRWYSLVACATPLLWSTIEASRSNIAWVELCLSRSMTAPLCISFRSPSDELLGSVARHSHRIRHLSIVHSWSTISLSFLHGSMPLLEKLELDGEANMSDPGFFDFEMTPSKCPLLRDLKLAFIESMPRNLTLYSNLRRLWLGNSTADIDLTLDQLYDILAACTRLEILNLNDFLSDLQPPDESQKSRQVPWRPLISFPHMKEMCLDQECHDSIALFLAHILLPEAMTRLGIYAVFRSNGSDARMAATLPADRVNTLPMLSKVNHVDLDMWDDEYRMYARTDADLLQGKVVLDLYADEIPGWDHFLQSRGILDLLDIFRYARLRRLWISGDFDTITRPNEWKTVFTAFSKLETLECIARGKSTPSPWLALHIAQSTEQAICPRLHTIRLVGCRLRGGEKAKLFFENAIACLRSRAARGNTLQKLDLQVKSKGDQAGAAMQRKYLPTVQQFVREVQLCFYH